MTLVQMLSIPLIGAFIGWVTTFLAIRMIFRPRRPVGLAGLQFQGLIPKHHAKLAHSIGLAVQQHLISQSDIMAILEREEFKAGLDEAIRDKIADFLDNKLGKINPMLAMLLGGSLRDKVEGLLIREVRRMVPELSARMMDKLAEKLNFQEIVEEKVRTFDLDELERMLQGIAHHELRAIGLFSGTLGFLIGLAQLGLMLI